MPESFPVGGQVVITHPIGLHARPAVKLTRLAKQFKASIFISGGKRGRWVDAKSIVRVMALKVKAGETLFFRALGPEAEMAVNALTSLVERNFEEDEPKTG